MIKAFLCAAIFAALSIGTAARGMAQDVTLTSRDGAIEVGGTLLGFDGEFYRIQTDFGVLTLDGQGVLCSGTGCPDLDAYVARFSFSGARSMGEVLMPALIEGFAARRGLSVQRSVQGADAFTINLHDGARMVAQIGFRLGSTADGFDDLLAETADIAMALREARPDEIDRARTAGLGDLSDTARSRIVALDALVPIVARDNPLREISVARIQEFLSGQITEWQAQAAPITIHARAEGSGIQELIEDRILSPAELTLVSGAQRHADDADLADGVAGDPLAFGMARLSDIGNARQLTLRGSCGMPLRATRRSLKAEDYPFAAPLFLYTPARRLPLFAREFLTYLTGPEAQRVIHRAGFVNQTREAVAVAGQGTRLLNAIAAAGEDVSLTELKRLTTALRGTERLTTTFRFRGGSTQLDAQSAGNIAFLARALEAGEFDERELIFVGFSDGDGGAAANLRLARKRAEAVRDAVKKAAYAADPSRIRLTVDAFGEAMPMACEEAEWGRGVNRRVEVWRR